MSSPELWQPSVNQFSFQWTSAGGTDNNSMALNPGARHKVLITLGPSDKILLKLDKIQ